MFINTLRSEFIENKTIRDGGITVLDYQSPSDHERQCQLENTYLQKRRGEGKIGLQDSETS